MCIVTIFQLFTSFFWQNFQSILSNYTPLHRRGGILLPRSVRPRYFSLHFSLQLLMAEITKEINKAQKWKMQPLFLDAMSPLYNVLDTLLQ
jgi:hypothetical protein